MERKNGFLIVDDYKKLPNDACISRGVYANCWLENQDTYLFKSYAKSLDCYREVVYSRIATKIGIPNVGYDLASYKGNLGVITKKCTNEVPISMEEILAFVEKVISNFFNHSPFSLLNIETIDYIMEQRYQKKENFLLEEFHKDLLIKFISSILFANYDLNANNLDFIESICKLLPLYDFGNCGKIQFSGFKGGYNFFCLKRFFTDDISEHPNITLQTFLKRAPKWEVDLFYEYLEKSCSLSLDDMYVEIESDFGTFMPSDVLILKKSIANDFQIIQKKCKGKF